MKAAVGDRIVVVSAQVGGVVRDGLVVELRHEDGSPPYVVEWSDTHQRAVYFPGSDGRIQHRAEESAPAADAPAAPVPTSAQPGHVRTWNVTVHLYEQGDETAARAVLHAESPVELEARGTARRAPYDPQVPEIGDEVAVARALHHLAEVLMAAATDDMRAVGERNVTDQAW
jgi:hypothetical protein